MKKIPMSVLSSLTKEEHLEVSLTYINLRQLNL